MARRSAGGAARRRVPSGRWPRGSRSAPRGAAEGGEHGLAGRGGAHQWLACAEQSSRVAGRARDAGQLFLAFAAGAIGALASGAWPWWLMPLGRRLTAWRVRRWAHPEEIGREAVRSCAAGRQLRVDRLDARRAFTGPARPDSPTWSGNRFRAAEAHVRAETGSDVASEWTRLLLAAPDTSRAALSEARDAYDAACEALAWSLAFILLGAWWWPAAPVGLLLWLASWGRCAARSRRCAVPRRRCSSCSAPISRRSPELGVRLLPS
ncbi:hypothetical protein ACFVYG_03155 [Streptomyces sp. NPDC058256]|uniref:hypothetical protein n=1 Tax=Streptomyces sp. NPDC058256 TaxID=3346408 RepID=UPI0036E9C848